MPGVVVQVARNARPLGDLGHACDPDVGGEQLALQALEIVALPPVLVRLAAGFPELAAPEMDAKPRERRRGHGGRHGKRPRAQEEERGECRE